MSIINTRIQLKYDTLANWNASTFKLKAGEIAIATLGEIKDGSLPGDVNQHPVLFKVGDGSHSFAQLPFASALAADVYAWAKASNVILEGKTLKFVNTDAEGKNVSIKEVPFDYVTESDVNTILADYYTKDQIDELVKDKLHTADEIKGYASSEIERLIQIADTNSEDGHTIRSIQALVDYVEENADDIAQLVTDVNTANTNASEAVSTANSANTTAGEAATVAGEAKTLAEEAKQAATDAVTGAAASASAASASASAAAGSASEAKNARDAAVAAQGAAEGHASTANAKAEAAADSAGEAAGSATLAGEKAEAAAGSASEAKDAKDAAVIAQGEAEEAQAAAEAAQTKAEEAQAAAEASNTSATAIANEAKSAAEAATEASNAATEAVAGLHAIATSGSVYDLSEVETNADNVKYLVFNCGTASTLID